MIKILTLSHIPERLQKDWLQHLRDFDTAHPGCHFQIVADADKARTMDEFEDKLREIRPGFKFFDRIEREDDAF